MNTQKEPIESQHRRPISRFLILRRSKQNPEISNQHHEVKIERIQDENTSRFEIAKKPSCIRRMLETTKWNNEMNLSNLSAISLAICILSLVACEKKSTKTTEKTNSTTHSEKRAEVSEDEITDEKKFSWSVAEAKQRKTFVCELDVSPKEINVDEGKVTFGSAWLERSTDKSFSLCFRLEKGQDILRAKYDNYFFVMEEAEPSSFSSRHFRTGEIQFIENLKSTNLDNVKVSLVRSWKEDRKKNITFKCR